MLGGIKRQEQSLAYFSVRPCPVSGYFNVDGGTVFAERSSQTENTQQAAPIASAALSMRLSKSSTDGFVVGKDKGIPGLGHR